MNIIIIEDEQLSAEHLCNLLKKIDATIRVLNTFDSIRKTIEAFQQGLRADLLFVDIHLADGLSFEIFKEIDVDTPIIFTTAYDEYALRAFKLNSIDYLLKPVGLEELHSAIDKFNKFGKSGHSVMLDNIARMYQSMKKQYKSRFMIKTGDNIVSVKTDDIAHFIFEDGIVLLATSTNHVYTVDFTLDQLETMLDPDEFFRINRQVIIRINSIQKTGTYFNSRLKITSALLPDECSVVSRERVNDFKEWLGR